MRAVLIMFVFAAWVVVVGAAVAMLVWSGGNSGTPGGPIEAAVWASLPAWSALAAIAAAVTSWQRRRSTAASRRVPDVDSASASS